MQTTSKNNTLQFLIFGSVFLINLFNIVNGIKKHEIWLTVAGSVALALVLIAITVKLVSAYKQSRGSNL